AACRRRPGAAQQAGVRLGGAGLHGQRGAVRAGAPRARVRELLGQRHRRALRDGPAVGGRGRGPAGSGQLAQVAHARVRVRSRAGGIWPGPQQLRPGARRPHGPAGLPRPQLHPHRGRSAVESRPPHLHPAPAVGCRQDAGVRPAAARGGDPGGVVVSARWLAIAFAVVLACPVLAQQPPNNDDMMESPPVAAPREGYWADVLAHDPVMARQGDTWYLFVTGPGITVYSSRDMETWKAETPVFPEIPA